jgi:hypothetical protein
MANTIDKAKNIAKKAKENYNKPTPKKWVKIGDAIQDIGIIIGLIAPFTPWQILSPISLILGKISKIISNFAV